jgi:hypothetical protein
LEIGAPVHGEGSLLRTRFSWSRDVGNDQP